MKIGLCMRWLKKNSYKEFEDNWAIPKAFVDILASFNVMPILLVPGYGISEIISQ